MTINMDISCQKGPSRPAYAGRIEPFWQDALDIPLHFLTKYQFFNTRELLCRNDTHIIWIILGFPLSWWGKVVLGLICHYLALNENFSQGFPPERVAEFFGSPKSTVVAGG